MVDTPRPLADLQALLADNVVAAISPNDVRDFLVSVFALTQKGGLAGLDAAGVMGELPPTTDGFTLVLDAASTYGFKWVAAGVGSTGATGPQGVPGADGQDGDQGDQGPPGPTGATGATGSTGSAGATGATGPQGVMGLDGEDGDDGLMGPPGAAGAVGATGATGSVGATGATGPIGIGIPGEDGEDGADGWPGRQGVDGAAGATGATGAAGAAGMMGPPGADGDDGDSGLWGIPHEAAHINHDTTWAAKGDKIIGTANDTAAVLSVGANDSIEMVDSAETTGLKYVSFYGRSLAMASASFIN